MRCSLVLLALFAPIAGAQSPSLYTVCPQDDQFRRIDPATGATLSSLTLIVEPGAQSVFQAHGLAWDATTDKLYAIVNVSGGPKELVTVDPATATCTLVGSLGDMFAGLAFDSQGNLFAVSGDGAVQPESLFAVNKATAANTKLAFLGKGNSGESIAFDPVANTLWHASGVGPLNNASIGTILEKVNPVTHQMTLVTLSGAPFQGLMSLTRRDATSLWFTDFGPQLMRVSNTGVATFVAPLDHLAKGIAWVDGPSYFEHYGAGCPGSGGITPSLTGRGSPNPGSLATLTVADALGGATGLLFFGSGTGSLPIVPSCALQVAPIYPQLILPLPLSGSGPGGGGIAIQSLMPITGTTFDIHMQLLVVDAGGGGGVASTPPLRMHVQ